MPSADDDESLALADGRTVAAKLAATGRSDAVAKAMRLGLVMM